SGFVQITASGSGLRLGAWQHVAVTVDGSVITFYVDGRMVSQAMQPIALTFNTFPFQIGSAAPAYGNRFNGIIDELSVYDRALTAQEVQAIVAAGGAGKCAQFVQHSPSITSSPVTIARTDQLYRYDVKAIDPDASDVLTFSLPLAPAGMTI